MHGRTAYSVPEGTFACEHVLPWGHYACEHVFPWRHYTCEHMLPWGHYACEYTVPLGVITKVVCISNPLYAQNAVDVELGPPMEHSANGHSANGITASTSSSKSNIEIETKSQTVHVCPPAPPPTPPKVIPSGLDAPHRLAGCHLWCSQYRALLVKRARYTQRRVLAAFVQNVLPLAVVLTSLVISYLLLDVANPPPLQLTPSLFSGESPDNYAFVGGLGTGETAPYRNALFNPCGLGPGASPRCTNRTSWASCSGDAPPILPCRCSSCRRGDDSDVTVPPCYRDVPSGSRLLDLTGNQMDQTEAYHNLTDYLLRTEISFAQRRYGGVSFGHERPEVSDYLDDYFSKYPNSSLPFLAVRGAAKAWYLNKGYHSVPAFLNSLNNAILRAHLDPSKDPTVHG